MKLISKSIVLGLLLAGSTASYGQGIINFFTFNNSSASLGKVFTDNNRTAQVAAGVVGQLWGSTTLNGSYTALSPSVAWAGSAASSAINFGNVTVSGSDAGATYFYQVRAWQGVAGSAYPGDNANSASSASVQVTLGGTPIGGGTPVSPPQANGFQNFNLAVPEPTTLAMLGLGAGALLIVRRRK